jgi:Flp pilus assembly protein protease CpaA
MKNNLALAALEQRLPPVPAKTPGRVTVPYGVAVSVGALITFLTI